MATRSRFRWLTIAAGLVVSFAVLLAVWVALAARAGHVAPRAQSRDHARVSTPVARVWSAPEGGAATARSPGPKAQFTAEQRRRYADWSSTVSISSLGAAPPGVDTSRLGRALYARRRELRACIEGLGGWRALHEAAVGSTPQERLRAARGGPPRVSIEIAPDGRIDASAITLEPPLPAPFATCFIRYFASAELGPIGRDGALAEFPLDGRFTPVAGAAGAPALSPTVAGHGGFGL